LVACLTIDLNHVDTVDFQAARTMWVETASAARFEQPAKVKQRKIARKHAARSF
jgi:hypothetical protein